jgi:hypothetical protein
MRSFSVVSFPRKRESRAPARAAKSGCPLVRISARISAWCPFRHGRAPPGHPRSSVSGQSEAFRWLDDVDDRDEPGHEGSAVVILAPMRWSGRDTRLASVRGRRSEIRLFRAEKRLQALYISQNFLNPSPRLRAGASAEIDRFRAVRPAPACNYIKISLCDYVAEESRRE